MNDAELLEKEREIEHQKDLERLKRFRPIDDTFMRAILRDNMPLAQAILQIIMEKPDLKLIKFNTQDDIVQVAGAHAVCLDVTGTDSEGKKYDVEVQRAGDGADPHRGRYNSAVMSVGSLHSGQDYDELPDVYVIFITEEDIYKIGAPLYPIQNINMVTGEPFGDGAYILYVNGEYRGNDDLGKLMHDFNCSDPDDMYFPMMAERSRYYKEVPEGVKIMCKEMEDLRNEAERKGEERKARESALNMYRDGMTVDKIAKYLECSVETIKKWVVPMTV